MYREKWYDSFPLFLTAFLIGVAVLMTGLMLFIRVVSIHYDKAECHSFAKQTGRETRFVTYTYCVPKVK